jgi:hypothetical protein
VPSSAAEECQWKRGKQVQIGKKRMWSFLDELWEIWMYWRIYGCAE